jgi:2-dehydro-3-deoxygalactonokinase
MTHWLASGGGRAALMNASRLVRMTDEAEGETLRDANHTMIRVGEGPADTLPAPVLPAPGPAVPGWQQQSPPDVIGAWTRLRVAGFLASRGDWDGVVCVIENGVSHWIHISAQEAVSCQSFLTPRLITALCGAAVPSSDAMADSLSRPERLAAHLRAAQVGNDPAGITGHLIGAELAAARPYWLGQQVAIIAGKADADAWTAALSAQGVPCSIQDADDMLAAGLAALGEASGLSD